MWRRVLSQSPTEVPKDPESILRTFQYLDGWKALGALLHSGHSLSGHERNCCFLNTRGIRFADASFAVGLDQDADSRGLAQIDWDGDGDLDLWMTNRTSPRLEYLQNDLATGNHFVAVKLRGVTCNRDAIGARAVLHLKDPGKGKLVRTISAGEGFVSQSSKWLHFGLGQQTAIDRLVVHWPDGKTDEIRGVEPDRRYEIVQGSGQATMWAQSQGSARLSESKVVPISPRQGTQRIVLAQRVPMPRLPILSLSGQQLDINQLFPAAPHLAITATGARWQQSNGAPQPGSLPALGPLDSTDRSQAQNALLINLWATWCQPCLEELSDWKRHAQQLTESGVRFVVLNVDHVADQPATHLDEIRSHFEQLDLPFTAGVIDAAAFELLEAVQRTTTLHQGPLPIPASFLLDSTGNLVAIYKGRLSAEQLLGDVGQLLGETPEDARDLAVPLGGQWYTEPFPPDLIAIPAQLVGLGRGDEAFDYLTLHVISADPAAPVDAWTQLGVTSQKVTNVLHGVAKSLLEKGRIDDAILAYRSALRYSPDSWETHVRLAELLIQSGRAAEAIAQSRAMLRLKPNHPLPWNNIAWILATATDPQIRDPEKAVQLAERICRATGRQEPTALDTLAVAYAAAGQFDAAVTTAEEAIRLAQSLGRQDLMERIRQKLPFFRERRPYVPSPSLKPHAPVE